MVIFPALDDLKALTVEPARLGIGGESTPGSTNHLGIGIVPFYPIFFYREPLIKARGREMHASSCILMHLGE